MSVIEEKFHSLLYSLEHLKKKKIEVYIYDIQCWSKPYADWINKDKLVSYKALN